MGQVRAGIVGASGYSGLELTRLLSGHSGCSLTFVTSDRWQGQSVTRQLPLARGLEGLAYVGNAEGLSQAPNCDVVFFATPAETSLELVPKLPPSCRAIDLAGTFRLQDASAYPAYYGFEHHARPALERAVYGLPELFRSAIPRASLVANPGCYATAAALSLAPLLKRGLVEPEGIVITAASGVSGAGRKASEDFTFMEVDGDVRAYKVFKHQHTPEIQQTLERVSGTPVRVVFTPQLLPIKRGILSTAVARLRASASSGAVAAAFSEDFGGEPLMSVMPSPDAVRIASVAQTPFCHVGAATDGRHVVAISALDNLLKGAASQAVQNFNLLFGFTETMGLV